MAEPRGRRILGKGETLALGGDGGRRRRSDAPFYVARRCGGELPPSGDEIETENFYRHVRTTSGKCGKGLRSESGGQNQAGSNERRSAITQRTFQCPARRYSPTGNSAHNVLIHALISAVIFWRQEHELR
jgi:hypothetical protein